MMPDFKITAKDADAVRRALEKDIQGTYLGIAGSYEEGVIDTIAWLLGESEQIAGRRAKKEKEAKPCTDQTKSTCWWCGLISDSAVHVKEKEAKDE